MNDIEKLAEMYKKQTPLPTVPEKRLTLKDVTPFEVSPIAGAEGFDGVDVPEPQSVEELLPAKEEQVPVQQPQPAQPTQQPQQPVMPTPPVMPAPQIPQPPVSQQSPTFKETVWSRIPERYKSVIGKMGKEV